MRDTRTPKDAEFLEEMLREFGECPALPVVVKLHEDAKPVPIVAVYRDGDTICLDLADHCSACGALPTKSMPYCQCRNDE